jgi:ABC-2 type transport system permease protein
MLATPTPRAGWIRGQLVPALAGGWLTLALAGLGLGAAYAVTGGGADQVPRLVLAALAYVPAVSVITALAVALFGIAPRWAMGAWVALGGCFVIAMFGSLLDLPDWVSALSPFHHTPAVPAHALQILPLAVLSALALALAAVGLVAFRRRDLSAA